MVKIYATIAGMLLVIGGIWGWWNSVHTRPMKKLNETVRTQKGTMTIYKITINNLDANLTICEAKIKSYSFEAYFEGGGGIEEVNTSNTSNIFLKQLQPK